MSETKEVIHVVDDGETEAVVQDGELADSELDKVSGGLGSSVANKSNDAGNAVLQKIN